MYQHLLPPNQRNCYLDGQADSLNIQKGVSSQHPGGVNTLMADGAVTFVSENVSIEVWVAAGSRDGGEPLDSLGGDSGI